MTDRSQPISFRYMFGLIWPIFVELLLQMLVGNVDQIMISNYQQEAVGSIANANQILNMFLLVFSMISMSITILVSQYKGAQSEKQVQVIYTLGFTVNFILGLIVSIILLFFSDSFFKLLRVPDVFLPAAREYIRIVGSFCFLQSLFSTFSAIFRSNQMMKVGMFISIITNLVNVIGNALFIYGIGPFPVLGVRGVAISTNISRLVGVLAMAVIFYRSLNGRIRLAHLRPFPMPLFRKMLSIGIPAGGESFSYNITQLVILTFVNGFGPNATMARAYCHTVSSFTLLYCLSVSQATQIVVGYHVGARDFQAADKTARWSALSSLIVTTCISIIIYLFSTPIFSLFGASQSVKVLCKNIMLINVLLQFGRSFNMLYLRALQGAGDIRFPITVGIIETWIVVVGLGYVFGCVLNWGLAGIWFAMALDENIRGVIFLLRWHSGIWKGKSLNDDPICDKIKPIAIE